MDKFRSFIMTTLLGGVMVILPVAIFAAVFGWIFRFVTGLIQPLTDLIVARADIKEILADLLVLIIILMACFVIGMVVRTRFGKFVYGFLEQHLIKIAPGYKLIKETVLQILGSKKQPFSSVVLAQIFGNETLVTAFVTDEHEDGSFTVFVPTGPNPTSGFIYHLDGRFVHKVDVPADEAMRSVISCGSGSAKLMEAYKAKK